MIDKPFYIIIAAYAFSFGFLGAQYLADSYGITLTAPDGTVIRNGLEDIIQISNINSAANSVNSTSTNQTGLITTVDLVVAAAEVAVTLFQLLTGTYVFNILYLFGIPAVFIVPIAVIYIILLARTVIALIRGV